jgi:hypothetical protein
MLDQLASRASAFERFADARWHRRLTVFPNQCRRRAVGETAFHKWFSRLVVLGEMVVGRPLCALDTRQLRCGPGNNIMHLVSDALLLPRHSWPKLNACAPGSSKDEVTKLRAPNRWSRSISTGPKRVSQVARLEEIIVAKRSAHRMGTAISTPTVSRSEPRHRAVPNTHNQTRHCARYPLTTVKVAPASCS